MNRLIRQSFLPSRSVFNINSSLLSNRVNLALRVFGNKAEGEDYYPIFNFPAIGTVAPICGLSKIVGAVSGITLPIIAGMEFLAQELPESSTYIFGIGAGIFSLTLLTCGQIFRNTIGYIYVTDDDKTIKVAYINRWGKRMETIIPVEDWVPLSKLSPNPYYLKTKQYSSSDRYKFFYRHGLILDEKVAKATIGSLPENINVVQNEKKT